MNELLPTFLRDGQAEELPCRTSRDQMSTSTGTERNLIARARSFHVDGPNLSERIPFELKIN